MLEKNIYYTYILLICSIIIIPSGWIYNVNIRMILMMILIFSLILFFFKKNHINKNILNLSFILIILCLIILTYSLFLGESNIKNIFEQLKRIVILLSLAIATYSLLSLNIIKLKDILILLIFPTFIYSFIKNIFVLGIFLGLIEYTYVETFLREIFHYEIVGNWEIFSNITRIQLINDILIPFSLYFLLNREIYDIKINKYLSIFISTVFILAIFVAYSRYIFLITIFVYFLTYTLRLKYKISIQTIFLSVALFLIIIFSLDSIIYLIEDRFFSAYNTYSDDLRKEQFDALIYEFSKYPLLGKGIGGYSEIIIRSEALPFLYEMQWIALLMQFGIIGIIIIIFLLVLTIQKMLSIFLFQFIYKQKIDKNIITILILYFLWLGASFTNPYLTSAISGIIFSIFLALDKFNITVAGVKR